MACYRDSFTFTLSGHGGGVRISLLVRPRARMSSAATDPFVTRTISVVRCLLVRPIQVQMELGYAMYRATAYMRNMTEFRAT
jgi:hypothetical protein